MFHVSSPFRGKKTFILANPRVNPGLCYFGRFGPQGGNVHALDPGLSLLAPSGHRLPACVLFAPPGGVFQVSARSSGISTKIRVGTPDANKSAKWLPLGDGAVIISPDRIFPAMACLGGLADSGFIDLYSKAVSGRNGDIAVRVFEH